MNEHIKEGNQALLIPTIHKSKQTSLQNIFLRH